MFMLLLLMLMLQPALASCTSDTRECPFIPGTMCPVLASGGSCGRFNSQHCVACSCLPSGILIVIGFLACCTLMVGASVVKKLLVSPESAIAKKEFCCSVLLGIRGIVNA